MSLHSLAEALGVDDVRGKAAELAAQLQDDAHPALEAWCRQAAQRLRDAVRLIENMLDPRAIVIGGLAPKALVERLVALAQPLLPSVRGGVAAPNERILLSERQEDSSLLGAAVLPLYELLSPRFEVLQQERRAEADLEQLLGAPPASRIERP